MTNMTLAVPEELMHIIKRHKDIKWAEVAREAMWSKAKKLELMDTLLSKTELTEKDAIEISRKIKAGVAKKHGIK